MNTAIAPQPAKILVVDDMQENLQLLNRVLTEQGYKVHIANSGKLALRYIEKLIPDIVLLDINMPDMDGYEVCRQMMADERFSDMPVIFISAMDASWNKAHAFAVGAVDYVVKPIDESEVLARVKTHLSLSGLRRHLERRVEERTAQLLTTQSLLKSIIDSSGAIIHVKDTDGRYLLVNQLFQRLFGKDDEDLHGRSDRDIFPDDVAAALHELDRQVIESGAPVEVEEILPHQDGPHTYISFKSPLRDLNGTVYAVCCVGSDITTRVREEKELRELSEMLESRLMERGMTGDVSALGALLPGSAKTPGDGS